MAEIEILLAELRKNLEVAQKIRKFLDATENSELAALGKTPATALMVTGILENYYTCLETLFLRVSQHFENHLDSQRWHQALLQKMTLRIPGIREAVLRDATMRQLQELMRFRHFKRYYFEFEYDWKRLDYLISVLKDVHGEVEADVAAFIAFLESASDAASGFARS
jgi:hypothetical protein